MTGFGPKDTIVKVHVPLDKVGFPAMCTVPYLGLVCNIRTTEKQINNNILSVARFLLMHGSDD